jgi:5-methylcytosine-specific restriction endonuclease McrA
MDRVEVAARGKLLDYIQGSGRKLTYAEKLSPEHLTAIASEIFKIPADIGFLKMAAAVASLGSAQRQKRRRAYRLAKVAKLKAEERRSCEKLVAPEIAIPVRPKAVAITAKPLRAKVTDEVKIRNFYDSWEWRRLSFDVKIERGRVCECCGARPPDVRIVTDHIKPLRHYWHLRLDKTNLQVLCDDCNKGKGSRDETDFRTGLSADGPRKPPLRVVWGN